MRPFQKPLLAAALFLLLPAAGKAACPQCDTLIQSGMETFQRGYNEWSVPVFNEAQTLFSKASELDSLDYRPHYWQGVVQFHISNYYLFGEKKSYDKKQGVKAVDAALTGLERSLALAPRHGESLALYGTLMGIKIYLKLYMAPVLGPKVFSNIKKGLELAEKNPRIHYLIGVNYLFTPGFLGGGVEKGLEYLLKGEKFYYEEASRPAEPLEPRWGFSTCLGFIGKAYIKQDEGAKAKIYFEKALEVNPRDQLSITGLKEAEALLSKGN